MIEVPLSILAGTSVAGACRELLEIYRGLDAETEAFSASCAVHCPPGCGRCCEGFSPPVTRIEADLVALFLLDAACPPPREGSADGQCPFYDAIPALHCAIHPVRPLICRGFGFCAFGGKDGRPRFSYCRHMPAAGPRHLDAAAMRLAFPRQPPRLDAHYAPLMALAHEAEAGQRTLAAALAESIAKVGSLLSYARG